MRSGINRIFHLLIVVIASTALAVLPACEGGDSCEVVDGKCPNLCDGGSGIAGETCFGGPSDCVCGLFCDQGVCAPYEGEYEDCSCTPGGDGDSGGTGSSNGGGGNGTLDGTDPVAAECDCGARVCGLDPCGNTCGECQGDTAFCFSGSCQTEDECPAVDFTMGEQTAYRMDDKGKERLRYEAVVSGSQFTKVEIISNRVIEEVGSLPVGVHDLRVDNLTGCDDVCVVAHMDCNKQECAFPYIATIGTLELTSAGADATQLTGMASELVFTQAYYDDKTRQYQVLKKAETVCMPGFDVDVALEQIIIEPTDCTPEGTGTTIGTEIGDFPMVNCAGDEITLHDNCGYEAVWVIAVADW